MASLSELHAELQGLEHAFHTSDLAAATTAPLIRRIYHLRQEIIRRDRDLPPGSLSAPLQAEAAGGVSPHMRPRPYTGRTGPGGPGPGEDD